jgi:uncharacterized membrane protein
VNQTVTAEIIMQEETPLAANPLLNRAVFIFSLLGLLVAGYLWHMHANPVDIPCGGSHGCAQVATSPYSRFPIGSGPPVAMYGTLGYLALATLAFLRTLPNMVSRDRLLLQLMTLGAGFGMVASLYLTAMELFVIDAICRWCIGSQILIIIVAALVGVEWLTRKRRAALSNA